MKKNDVESLTPAQSKKIDELMAVGITEEAAVGMVVTMDNRSLNNEELAVGDILHIKGMASDVSSFDTDDGDKAFFMNVLTSGSRGTVSISRLIGTAKPQKVFTEGAEWLDDVVPEAFNKEDYFYLNERTVADAAKELMLLKKGWEKDHAGKTYTLQIVARAERVASYGKTYWYLFKVIE
jgi:hypothetical protein